MRLIDAERLKEDYKKYVAIVSITSRGMPGDATEDIRGCIDRLDASPTVHIALQWISVDDELPPEKGEYLVAYWPCHWDRVYRNKGMQVSFDSYRGNGHWAKNKYQLVTYWMEKPEPPHEESEANQ